MHSGGGGVTCLLAAGSAGSGNIAAGCATCPALSVMDSFNSLQTTQSSSCRTVTRLSMLGEG